MYFSCSCFKEAEQCNSSEPAIEPTDPTRRKSTLTKVRIETLREEFGDSWLNSFSDYVSGVPASHLPEHQKTCERYCNPHPDAMPSASSQD